MTRTTTTGIRISRASVLRPDGEGLEPDFSRAVGFEHATQPHARFAGHIVHQEATVDLDIELAGELATGFSHLPDQQPMRAAGDLRHQPPARREKAPVDALELLVAH